MKIIMKNAQLKGIMLMWELVNIEIHYFKIMSRFLDIKWIWKDLKIILLVPMKVIKYLYLVMMIKDIYLEMALIH